MNWWIAISPVFVAKPEFFVAGTMQILSTLSPIELKVGDSIIKPSDTVWNLNIILDSRLSMTPHTNSMISSISFQLRKIRRIKHFLDHDTLHAVVRALVLSRLDYGNALLYRAKSKDLDQLQLLHHKATKLIFSAARRYSPSPLMHKLHRLPLTLIYPVHFEDVPCQSGVNHIFEC